MTADFEKINAAWSVDNKEYDVHFEQLVRSQPKNGEEPSDEHKESVRQFWKATAHLLNQYVRAYAQHRHYLEPMPLVPLARLAFHFEELGNGIVPELIENARAAGRPMRGGERQDISRALFYLEEVKSGALRDNVPVKTVAGCFNVTKQTVRNWRTRKAELCKGQPRPHPNLIDQAMRDAGTRYTIVGRGAPSE